MVLTGMLVCVYGKPFDVSQTQPFVRQCAHRYKFYRLTFIDQLDHDKHEHHTPVKNTCYTVNRCSSKRHHGAAVGNMVETLGATVYTLE